MKLHKIDLCIQSFLYNFLLGQPVISFNFFSNFTLHFQGFLYWRDRGDWKNPPTSRKFANFPPVDFPTKFLFPHQRLTSPTSK